MLSIFGIHLTVLLKVYGLVQCTVPAPLGIISVCPGTRGRKSSRSLANPHLCNCNFSCLAAVCCPALRWCTPGWVGVTCSKWGRMADFWVCRCCSGHWEVCLSGSEGKPAGGTRFAIFCVCEENSTGKSCSFNRGNVFLVVFNIRKITSFLIFLEDFLNDERIIMKLFFDFKSLGLKFLLNLWRV